MQVSGKVAVITGSSRGVGRATAVELAQRGCHVLVNYRRSKEAAEQTLAAVQSHGVKAISVAADVAEDAACRMMMDRAVSELGGLDILVNNAATTDFIAHSDMEAVTDEVWDRILGVNVKGAFQCVRAAVPHMHPTGGEIVNISSIAGLNSAGSSIPYCASKAALINMTTNMARALSPTIRVNAIAPGFIDSEWTRNGLGDSYDAAAQANASISALQRICLPEEIAQAIVSLITGADIVTGQTIVVDAGKLIGPKAS